VSVRTLRTPSYRRHTPSGQAVVTLDGRDFYLGRFGSDQSHAEYDRLIAEWLSGGRQLPSPASPVGSDLTVNELLLAFVRWAESYYRKGGRVTGEVTNIKYALRTLRGLYGHTQAREFGALQLKAARQAIIEAGLCRNEVNRRVRIITRAFKWAVGEGMISPTVHHGLQAVAGLRRGRCDVRESEPVRPVPEVFVDAIKPFVSRQVWALVELARLTGMRPGEACAMRSGDLDRSGPVWVYTPGSHKTEHHGRERRIYLGPQAQAVAREWLRADLSAYLYQPREAEAERRAEQRRRRRSPVQQSQQNRRKRRPAKAPGDRYTPDSLRQAVVNACRRAGVPDWHPNQLRHNAATRLRREFGLDVARAVLGHSSTAVTEVYAELDAAKAAEAMERVG
jgi:integrase